MDNNTHPAIFWAYPLTPAGLGAVILLLVAEVGISSLTAAAVLVAAGIASGLLLAKRHAATLQGALSEQKQSLHKQHQAEVESFLGGLNSIENEITSLWVKQIETGRSQPNRPWLNSLSAFPASSISSIKP